LGLEYIVSVMRDAKVETLTKMAEAERQKKGGVK
jgi:hypothetical protein